MNLRLLELEFAHNWAPIVGTITGACISLRHYELTIANFATGSVTGLISGCVLWVLVHPANEKAGPENISPSKIFWAILSLLLGCIPFLGLLVALIGFGLTISCKKWVRTCTLIGLGISLLSIMASFGWLVFSDSLSREIAEEKHRITAQLDHELIRNEAEILLVDQTNRTIDPSSWPSSIIESKPKWVALDNGALRIEYGGGWAHYGLIIDPNTRLRQNWGVGSDVYYHEKELIENVYFYETE